MAKQMVTGTRLDRSDTVRYKGFSPGIYHNDHGGCDSGYIAVLQDGTVAFISSGLGEITGTAADFENYEVAVE